MKKSRVLSVALIAGSLAVVAACSGKNIEGSMEALIQTLLDPSADRALLNATSAALRTTDAQVLAYKWAMTATGVKERTVEEAIRAYQASRNGGLQEQLETAYSTTVIIIDSGVAEKISKAAADPEFRRSWAKVEPHFRKSQTFFELGGKLQGYATTKFTLGTYFQGQQIKSGMSSKDAGTKFKSAVLGVKLLTQVVEILPKLLSNYEKLNELDKQLQTIPNYAAAEAERTAAGNNLNQVQLAALNTEANEALKTGEPAFGSLFDDEAPEAASDVADAETDAKLKWRDYCTRVQTALQSQDHYKGRIDGICGPGSRNAIRAFKRANGLGIDAEWTKAAEDALFKS